MKETTIISEENFVTPVKVQDAIRIRFAFNKSIRVNVKFNFSEKCFDLFEDGKYICAYNEYGNEV